MVIFNTHYVNYRVFLKLTNIVISYFQYDYLYNKLSCVNFLKECFD